MYGPDSLPGKADRASSPLRLIFKGLRLAYCLAVHCLNCPDLGAPAEIVPADRALSHRGRREVDTSRHYVNEIPSAPSPRVDALNSSIETTSGTRRLRRSAVSLAKGVEQNCQAQNAGIPSKCDIAADREPGNRAPDRVLGSRVGDGT